MLVERNEGSKWVTQTHAHAQRLTMCCDGIGVAYIKNQARTDTHTNAHTLMLRGSRTVGVGD